MPPSTLSGVVATAARAATPPVTDGELLRRFVRTREEDAFAALVRRLGPMVLGVCRRVSGDGHLAEDAFQAAFVVLARRAAEVRPAESVRGWVYGVAVRTARGVRAVNARRRAREVPVPALPDRAGGPVESPDADALAILDEEVAALPEHLRVAVVLCELDGVSRRAAAARLAVAEGTLSSRLAKARKLLAGRLRKRGVSLPAAGLGVLATSAPVPARLAATTSALASSGALLPPAVAALSNGVFRAMLIHKLTLGAACGLLLAAACLVVGRTLPAASATDPPKPPTHPARVSEPPARPAGPTTALTAGPLLFAKPAPAPKVEPAGPGTLLLARKGPCWLLTPGGKKGAELGIPENTQAIARAYFSPDGTRAALLVCEPGVPRIEDPHPFKIAVRRLDKPDAKPGVWDWPAEGLDLCWTADGKKLVASKSTHAGEAVENVLLDPDTGKTEPLGLPAGVSVIDAAKDGKTFLVVASSERGKKRRLGIAERGGDTIRGLTDLKGSGVRGRFSPDGTKVLFTDEDPGRKDAFKCQLSHRPYVLDVRTKTREALAGFPENGWSMGVAWSPDGTRVAYTWKELHADLLQKDYSLLTVEEDARETESFLVVADADGRNAKAVASEKGRSAREVIFGTIDWR